MPDDDFESDETMDEAPAPMPGGGGGGPMKMIIIAVASLYGFYRNGWFKSD